MHITVSRVLGFLLFLALIGYAFFVGPRISTLSLRPAVGTAYAGFAPVIIGPLVDPASHAPVHAPLVSAE